MAEDALKKPELPYFDLILEGKARGQDDARVFENFVHWGYWKDPKLATKDQEELVSAMAHLNDEVLKAADLSSGQTILDAGCGFGGTLRAIDKRLAGLRLTGLNLDTRQLEWARKTKTTNGNAIDWVHGNACQLPFADASFDRVLAVECIFHFPSRQRFLSEAARVLKPGGILALSDFVPRVTSRHSDPISKALERAIIKGYGEQGEGWIHGGYPDMAKRSRLTITVNRDITKETLPTYPALLELIQRGGFGSKKMMAWPTRLLYWISALGLVRYRILAFRK